MKPLRKGEYNLVHISLIGRDPISGRSFEECRAEWKAELDIVAEEARTVRWWQIIRRVRVAWKIAILEQRQGLT